MSKSNKKFTDLNKDERKEYYRNYSKDWYRKNKDKILKKGSENVYCKLCDKEIKKYNMSSHKKGKVHSLLMENKKNKRAIRKLSKELERCKNDYSY